jgi:hypothetical protein
VSWQHAGLSRTYVLTTFIRQDIVHLVEWSSKPEACMYVSPHAEVLFSSARIMYHAVSGK